MEDLIKYKIIIRETGDHHSPIGYDWYLGFIEAGCDVALVKSAATLRDCPTDVDVYVDMVDIEDPHALAYAKRLKEDNPKSKVLAAVLHPLDKQEKCFDYVDYWFDCGYEHLMYNEWYGSRGQKFLSVLEGTNPKLFYKGEVDQSDVRDFSFIGQFGIHGHGYRGEDQYLFPLIDDTKLTNYLYGFGYKNHPLQHINYTQTNIIYNSTKINLNFHYPEQKTTKTVINKRTFDIAGSGNFQLIDHPKFEELTGIKAYSDPKEYRDAFYYYVDKPEKRNEVASRAQQIILEKHTWKVRMEDLLNKIYK